MREPVAGPARRTIVDAFRDNPEWRKLFLARTVSLLGDWLNTLAIVHLLGQGDSTEALALAGVFVLKQLPVAILGPAAGVVADRFDRRRTMIGCDLLSCVAVTMFFFAEPGETHALVYVLTLLQVGINTFYDPPYRAVLPDLVRADDLVTANALGSVAWSAMFAAGTALGGVVLYTLGWKAAFGIDAATYLVSAVLVSSIRSPATAPPPVERDRGLRSWLGLDDLIEGGRYIFGQAPVRRLISVKLIWGLMGALTLFLTILGTTDAHRLAGSADLGVSFLWFSRGVGTGLGPVLARAWTRGDPTRLRRSIAVGYATALGFYAVAAYVEVWWLAGLLVLCAHIGGSVIWVMSTVLLQQTVPSGLRGRTFAAELGVVMLSSSISHLTYGALLDYAGVGVRDAILIAVVVTAVPALVWSLRVGMAR